MTIGLGGGGLTIGLGGGGLIFGFGGGGLIFGLGGGGLTFGLGGGGLTFGLGGGGLTFGLGGGECDDMQAGSSLSIIPLQSLSIPSKQSSSIREVFLQISSKARFPSVLLTVMLIPPPLDR